MATNADPYRTLGLTRDATLAQVKQAYRRLAKANHPDAAGEAALPRFLAIQAAYDQIAGPGASGGAARHPGGAASPPPWGADPDRANATHRAYGGRARRTRASGARRGSGGTTTPPRPGPPPPPRSDRPSRPPNKATLGSTSYDGAEGEPFEPDWGGASWYGTTSGTYWTLNPREYADPRKHGPEYQARGRRAAAAAADRENATEVVGGDGVTDPGPEPVPPTHTTSSWWDATAGPAADPAAGPAMEGTPAAADASSADAAVGGSTDAPVGAETARSPETARSADPGLAGRLARAVLWWIPIALAIGWVGGEITGCGRYTATCDPGQSVLVLVAQIAVLAILAIRAARPGRRPVS